MEENRSLPPGLVDRIGRLKWIARRAAEGLFSGAHPSPHFGASVEFNEHKQYLPGDDIRHIDWRIAAKSDRYYVKRFEKETDLTALLIVDASDSMAYGAPRLSKLDFAAQFALSLTCLFLRQSDPVGLLYRAEGEWRFIPPSGQWTQFNLIAEALGNLKAGGRFPADLLPGEILRSAPRATFCVALSDFFWDEEAGAAAFKALALRKKEVTAVQILDPDELQFPFRLRTRFKDMEAQRDLTAEPLAVRKSYLALLGKFMERLKRTCHENGVDYLRCDTGEALERHLFRLVSSRESTLR